MNRVAGLKTLNIVTYSRSISHFPIRHLLVRRLPCTPPSILGGSRGIAGKTIQKIYHFELASCFAQQGFRNRLSLGSTLKVIYMYRYTSELKEIKPLKISESVRYTATAGPP
jgi:hypothetical protein